MANQMELVRHQQANAWNGWRYTHLPFEGLSMSRDVANSFSNRELCLKPVEKLAFRKKKKRTEQVKHTYSLEDIIGAIQATDGGRHLHVFIKELIAQSAKTVERRYLNSDRRSRMHCHFGKRDRFIGMVVR